MSSLPADVRAFTGQVEHGIKQIKDPELKNLVRSSTKAVRKDGTTLKELVAGDPAQLEADFGAWKSAGGKEPFEDWLARSQAGRPHQKLSYPAGLVEEGLDAAGARRSYEASLREDPTREVAIWRDPVSGERVCVQGEHGFVETSWMREGDNLRNGRMPRWELEMHHHPARGIASDALPSSADFQSIMHWQTAEGSPRTVRSVLTYVHPESKLRFETEFGFVAGAKRPYWARFRVEDGTFKVATFENAPWAEGAAEYDAFVKSFRAEPNAPVPGGNVYPVAEAAATPTAPTPAGGVPAIPAAPRNISQLLAGGLPAAVKDPVRKPALLDYMCSLITAEPRRTRHVWVEPALSARPGAEGQLTPGSRYGLPDYVRYHLIGPGVGFDEFPIKLAPTRSNSFTNNSIEGFMRRRRDLGAHVEYTVDYVGFTGNELRPWLDQILTAADPSILARIEADGLRIEPFLKSATYEIGVSSPGFTRTESYRAVVSVGIPGSGQLHLQRPTTIR